MSDAIITCLMNLTEPLSPLCNRFNFETLAMKGLWRIFFNALFFSAVKFAEILWYLCCIPPHTKQLKGSWVLRVLYLLCAFVSLYFPGLVSYLICSRFQFIPCVPLYSCLCYVPISLLASCFLYV